MEIEKRRYGISVKAAYSTSGPLLRGGVRALKNGTVNEMVPSITKPITRTVHGNPSVGRSR